MGMGRWTCRDRHVNGYRPPLVLSQRENGGGGGKFTKRSPQDRHPEQDGVKLNVKLSTNTAAETQQSQDPSYGWRAKKSKKLTPESHPVAERRRGEDRARAWVDPRNIWSRTIGLASSHFHKFLR